MTDNQIKIRIQIPQSSNQTEQYNPDHEQTVQTVQDEAEDFPFDKRKILLALLLVGGLLCWIGFTIYQWISDAPTVVQTTTTDNTVVTTNKNQAFPTNGKSESGLTEQNAENKNDALTTSSKTLTTLLPPEKLNIKKPIITVAPKPLAKPNNITPAITATSTNTTQAILPPEVTRIQLTRTIEQREPTDTIDQVWLKQGASERIYLFLQLRNLSGQKVSVHWHYEDQEIAIVKLEIGNQNWRTNASKLLSEDRLGAWRVVLRDQSGNLLAQRNFTVSIRP